MLLIAALLLSRINVSAFHQKASSPTFEETLALASD
jgi:hypothetical protein